MSSWFIVLVFSITVYAISNHFIYASGPFHIYEKIRAVSEAIHPHLGELFNCMICFPTWVGIILSVGNSLLVPSVSLTPFMIILGNLTPWWVVMVFDGFFASGVTWLIHTTQEALERSGNNGKDG